MVHVYFDAATNQQTGENGLGVWLKASDGTVITFTEKRTGLSSVQAELAALVFALKQAEALEGESTFLFYSDAETIVRALEQRFMKDKSVKPLFLEALIAYDELPVTFIKWIPRADNRADSVAKAALLGR
ncbi:reverse transcriptase-like protein [Exiguobacterium sp. SH0S1]|uniref:reverse transcriptase-like protein n=1 Tax=Exiguobacterium sp. SH0S1 TaxID=2510949 RepID=UPI00103FA6CC|nr:reverse transcriptase-like protein [Exiguobacterium sp. SH0S1]TCI80291.1 reverse transcriptase-like protein [Exiguobacterium sp. SH0S1]